ncbi:MAG TPA: hypothetical protein VKD28_02005 [Gemmatimonadales bacterium]|nr:hypothetical protein [Gemmatimonadales bacterium]
MPRMIVELSKADHSWVFERARREGVSPASLVSWLLKEKLTELARQATESAEPEQAA